MLQPEPRKQDDGSCAPPHHSSSFADQPIVVRFDGPAKPRRHRFIGRSPGDERGDEEFQGHEPAEGLGKVIQRAKNAALGQRVDPQAELPESDGQDGQADRHRVRRSGDECEPAPMRSADSDSPADHARHHEQASRQRQHATQDDDGSRAAAAATNPSSATTQGRSPVRGGHGFRAAIPIGWRVGQPALPGIGAGVGDDASVVGSVTEAS